MIVFLGDSITEGGRWSDWFPDLPVRNHGIGGETSAQILHRVDGIVAAAPRAVFLLAGTNDLRDGLPPGHTIANLTTMVAKLAGTPSLFVQSILPRERENADRVRVVNTALAQLAGDRYLDLWPIFAEPDGELRAEFTYDRLHLTDEGYAAWRDFLRPYVLEV
jgi:lysophospholipase L1-like esterase